MSSEMSYCPRNDDYVKRDIIWFHSNKQDRTVQESVPYEQFAGRDRWEKT